MANPISNTIERVTANHSTINTQTEIHIHTPARTDDDNWRLCLQSLAFPQIESRSHDITDAVPGTCEWLLRHDTYKRWAACDRGLLWIKGKPGSGKSTLLKYALDNREATHDDLVLSFFFHGRGGELQRTPLGFFRSLLHQVLQQVPDSLPGLLDTFKKKREKFGEPGEKWQWHQEELRRFFESSLLKVLEARSVWLFVDALDESGKENAVNLFQWLNALLKAFSPTRSQSRVCVTCRHYPILDKDCDLEICPEYENRQDISTYVRGKLSSCHELATSPLPALITAHASGVFMWACLVVKRVLDLEREGVTLKSIKATIHSIPPDLGKLYQELLRNMSSDSLKLIQWICFATRPLSLDELRWAMVVEADSPHRSLRECESREDYVSDNNRMKRRVHTLSCGLAEVTPSSPTQVIQFIHQSVKDFFVEKGLSALNSNLTSTDAIIGMAHYRLARICIRYLAMEEVSQSTSFNNDFPFLRYATTSWVAHTKQCDTRGVVQDDILELFAWPYNDLVDLWVRVYRQIDEYPSHCPPSTTSLVHVMSRYGVLGPLTAILQKESLVVGGVDSRDGSGRTPLSYAAENGHEAIINSLLATGEVGVDSKDNSGQTPLSYAAGNGHKAIVELLLATGRVDINLKGGSGQTPLSCAAKNGHESVTILLLAIDKVDVNSKDNLGQTPLSYAAENGHIAIVKLLLATGEVDVDMRDGLYRTPLWYAARNGHEAVVKLLLATGKVDVDKKDGLYQTPLWNAARNGHEAVVKLLLATGKVHVDMKDAIYQTPLWYAARNGHKAVVKVLLATGEVDVDV